MHRYYIRKDTSAISSVNILKAMGRYQCSMCYREFARSDSLRRHKSSGVCKAMSETESSQMSDSEESTVSEYGASGRKVAGEDIFGKYDKNLRGIDSDVEESEMETDIEMDDDKEETHFKKGAVKPWNKILTTAHRHLQDDFNDNVKESLNEQPGMSVEEAEDMAYEELEPEYRSEFISNYKQLVRLGTALKRDPLHKKIMSTAKRLVDEEDYDDDEAMQYAIKKRRYLLQRKLDEYERPSYMSEEEETGLSFTLPTTNTGPFIGSNSYTNKRKIGT